MTYEEERAQIIAEYHRNMELLQTPRPPSRIECIIDSFFDAVEAFIDFVVTIPPLSWLDALLRGPVGRNR